MDPPNMAKDFFESGTILRCSQRTPTAPCTVRIGRDAPVAISSTGDSNDVSPDGRRSQTGRSEQTQQEAVQSKLLEDGEVSWDSSAEIRRRIWRRFREASIEQKTEADDDADDGVPYHPVHSPFSVRPRFIRFGAEARKMTQTLGSDVTASTPCEHCRNCRSNAGSQLQQENGEQQEKGEKQEKSGQHEKKEEEREQQQPVADSEHPPEQTEDKNSSTESLQQIDSKKIAVSPKKDESPPAEEIGRERKPKVSAFAAISLAKRLVIAMAGVLVMTVCISATRPEFLPSLYENCPTISEPAKEFLKGLEAIWPDVAWLPCPWQVSDKEDRAWNMSLAAYKKSMDSAVAAVDRVPLVLHRVGKQVIDWCKSVCAQLFADEETGIFPPILEEIWGCEPRFGVDRTASNQTYFAAAARGRPCAMGSPVDSPKPAETMQSSTIEGFPCDLPCESHEICTWPVAARGAKLSNLALGPSLEQRTGDFHELGLHGELETRTTGSDMVETGEGEAPTAADQCSKMTHEAAEGRDVELEDRTDRSPDENPLTIPNCESEARKESTTEAGNNQALNVYEQEKAKNKSRDENPLTTPNCEPEAREECTAEADKEALIVCEQEKAKNSSETMEGSYSTAGSMEERRNGDALKEEVGAYSTGSMEGSYCTAGSMEGSYCTAGSMEGRRNGDAWKGEVGAYSAGSMEGSYSTAGSMEERRHGDALKAEIGAYGTQFLLQGHSSWRAPLILLMVVWFCMVLRFAFPVHILGLRGRGTAAVLRTPSSKNSTSKMVGHVCTECASSPTALGSYIQYVESPGKLTPVRRSIRLCNLVHSPAITAR